jgi:hypothetical protein
MPTGENKMATTTSTYTFKDLPAAFVQLTSGSELLKQILVDEGKKVTITLAVAITDVENV